MTNKSFYDIFDKVQNLEDPLKADALFEAIKEAYGVKHVLYSSVNGPVKNIQDFHIQGTYTREWLQHYMAHDYASHDPVTLNGFTATQAFDWADLPKSGKMAQQVFNESIEFGFGKQGLTIPIVTHNAETALLNINSEESDKQWAARKSDLTRELQVIAQFYHYSIASRKLTAIAPPQHNLSDKELECLKWAASGKSVWETSVITNENERAVRFRLDQARRKMKCSTKTQAVAMAVAIGMINIS